jgi:hypothetical protein
MKSWKIGAIAGLIAGIFGGIVASISNTVANIIGLPNQNIFVPTTNIPEIYILINLIWGIIFGIIFTIVYGLIPDKYISKGLFYGLFIFLVTNFRDSSYLWPTGTLYLPVILSTCFIGFFQSIAYGSILAPLYKTLLKKYGVTKVERKIKTYDVKGGIIPGAIAGLLGGVFALISRILGGIIGLFPFFWVAKEGEIIVVEDFFIIFLSGIDNQLLINLIWGIVFGIIFTKLYNLVPGKGIRKGIFYGIIFFLVASLRYSLYLFLWGDIIYGWAFLFIGFFNALFYGLFLGILYKPPK